MSIEPISELGKRMVKARSNHQAFNTMLRASMSSRSKFSTEKVINDWWRVAFLDKEFTEMTLAEANLLLQYQLLYQGYIAQEIMMSKKFLTNYNAIVLGKGEVTESLKQIQSYEKLSEAGNITINLNKEGLMTSKKSNSTSNDESSVVKTGVTKTRNDICALILEQKYTNEQIAEKAGADLKTVSKMFRQLNNGKRKGFDKPEKPYEQLVDADGKLVPKSDAPKKSKGSKKVDPEKDPLKKSAGIDVHGKKATPEKKKIPAKKKTTSSRVRK